MSRLIRMLLWGHCLENYRQMFALTDEDLERTFLDYGSGPASFNTELVSQGGRVISCDELYDKSFIDLQSTFDAELEHMHDYIEAHLEAFHWEQEGSREEFEEKRRQSVNLFLQDYELGRAEGRYCKDECPALGFKDNTFEIAVASHAMFITHADKPPEYIVAAILELCRVARDVRLFPLLDAKSNISPLVGPVLLALQNSGFEAHVKEVDYHFQKGGNAMLRVFAHA